MKYKTKVYITDDVWFWKEEAEQMREFENALRGLRIPSNICPYCKEDFQGKGYIYKVEHNCPEWLEFLKNRPPATLKDFEKWINDLSKDDTTRT